MDDDDPSSELDPRDPEAFVSRPWASSRPPRGDELVRLLRALETHELELETQNEELRDAQLELQFTRDRYVDLYERAPVGYLTLDRTGVIRSANLTAAELLGTPRQSLVNRPLVGLLGPQSAAELHPQLERAFASTEPLRWEAQAPNVSQAATFLRLTSLRSVGDGDELRVAISDVSELRGVHEALRWANEELEARVLERTTELEKANESLRRSEARLWLLADNLPAALAYVDAEERVTLVNRAAATLSHRAPEEMLGRTVAELGGEALYAKVREHFHEALRGREVRFETRVRSPEGPRWTESVFVPDVDREGHVRGLFALVHDITARRSAEQAVRERNVELDRLVEERTAQLEERIRHQATLVDAIPDAVISTDLDFVVRSWNSAAEEMYGWTSEQAIGRVITDVVPTEDVDDLAQRPFRAALEHPGVWRGHLHQRCADGVRLHIDASVSPVLGPDAQPQSAVLVFKDVTEAKAAHERLREREARLDAVVSHAIDGIITIDEHGIVESFNPAAEEMFGYSALEVLGENVSILMDSPDDKRHDAYLERYRRTNEPRMVGRRREVVGRRKNGSTFPVSVGVSESKEGRRLFTAVLRDITPQAEADEALRTQRDFAEGLIETAPIIVLVLDPEGRVVRFNRYMEELTGHRLEDVRGADWFETFLPARIRDDIRGVFSLSLAGDARRGQVNPILARDGTERLIEWHDTLLEDENGQVSGLLVVGSDITNQRRLEETYRQAQKMEAVGTLAAGIAHDFNNLLMGIIGMADMSLAHLDPEHRAASLIEQILKAARGGAEIVSQLLSFSRRGATIEGDAELDAVIIDHRAILGTLLGEDVRLRLDLGAPGRRVQLSIGHLQQVLMNFAANARQAMPTGGTLTISSRCVTFDPDEPARPPLIEPGTYIDLRVSDTGTGMTEETRARVFEPFFTTKSAERGTGLGLSSVYAIVRQAGGFIEVETEPFVGTAFRMLVPSIRPSQIPPPMPGDVASVGKGESILVVEDEPLVRMTLAHYLGAEGYTVYEAGDAGEAAAICRDQGDTLALVLTDMVLPGAQGTDLARHIRDILPTTPVLFMSAHPPELLVHENRMAAGTPLLQKPFTRADVSQAVRATLDLNRDPSR